MSTSRYFDRICVIVLICALLITVLFMNGQSVGIKLIVDADSEAYSDSDYFTENDQLSGWDTSSATYITLEGDTISISGNNAYVYEGSVVISGSGKYVITGTLDDGYISVDANANSKVWILFQGVDVSCSDNACLRVDEADKVFLTLAEGTENFLAGGEDLSEEALEDGTYGVIFAHDDLTINGNGSLNIRAGYRHGIKANDDMVITGGNITVNAPADGIHVNDSFRLKDASVSITAGDDGILTENEDSFFYLESGDITVDAEDDGIHSNGDVIIAGGAITMEAGDDGIHADGSIEIEGGVIKLNSCYEGIEAGKITVSGGDITIYPADDGFNASSGSSAEGNMFGNGGRGPGNAMDQQNRMDPSSIPEADNLPMQIPETGNEQQEAQEDTENYIRISGGTITIINEKGNDADGLDSNGDIFISGGDIRISLADSGTNSAIDVATEAGGVAEVSGGTVIACGSNAMAEMFDLTSSQCSVMYNISSGIEAGACLSVKDGEGTEILSWEVPCSFSSAVLSSPAMQIGESYTVTFDENEETITLSEISASFGDAQSTMFGGTMNWGGMKKRERGTEEAGPAGETMPGQAERGKLEEEGFPVGGPDAGIEGEHGEDMADGEQKPAATEQDDIAHVERNTGMRFEQNPEQNRQVPGSAQGGPGEAPNDAVTENASDETAETGAEDADSHSLSAYGAEVWKLLVLSVLVLGAGLFIAKTYRRR